MLLAAGTPLTETVTSYVRATILERASKPRRHSPRAHLGVRSFHAVESNRRQEEGQVVVQSALLVQLGGRLRGVGARETTAVVVVVLPFIICELYL